MSWKTAIVAAGLAALVGVPVASHARSPAEAAAKPQRQCFWTSQVNGFRAVDDKTVYISVGVREVYEFQMLGSCPDVDWTQRIALDSRGASTICTGLDAAIVTPTLIGPQRCPVRAVRKLTRDEIAALPRRARP